MEKTMTIDRNTKILLTVFTIALLLNGLNPWIYPPAAGAKENAAISGNSSDTDCSSARNNSIKSLDGIKNAERLLGYIESSVNDIKLTVNGIDRKIDKLPSFKSADRR
jgi:hypothetical protein